MLPVQRRRRRHQLLLLPAGCGLSLTLACGTAGSAPDAGACTPAAECARQRDCTASATDFTKVCDCGRCATTGDADTLTTLKVNVIPLRPATPRSHLTRAYHGRSASGEAVTCAMVTADPRAAGLNELYYAQASNIPTAYDLITMPIAQPKGTGHVVYVELYSEAAAGGERIGRACKADVDVTGNSQTDTYTMNAER